MSRPGAKAAPGETRRRIARLFELGLSTREVAKQLGLSRSTVSFHAARLGRPRCSSAANRYDWERVQSFYDDGHSPRECCERFGFNRLTNLRLLCPNCHSQTGNFGGRALVARRRREDAA